MGPPQINYICLNQNDLHMAEEIRRKFKVFVSYSWTTSDLQDWVIDLAQRLVAIGIDVVLDKWNLKKGHDKYAFMEQSVTDSQIDKVLIILDKGYAAKADTRTGGVGTETQIISPNVYAEVRQEKFIPIIYERDEQNEIYSPAFLKNRVYIDLSNEATFEENFEDLVKTIIERPSHKKPALGELPEYLFDEEETRHKTTILLQRFEHVIRNKPKLINGATQEFLNEFLTILTTLTIKVTDPSSMTVGKQIIDILDQYAPRKDEFVQFFDKLLRSGEPLDVELLIHFLEKAHVIQETIQGRYNAESEPCQFAINEIFLSLNALAIKYKDYYLLGELIHSKYVVRLVGFNRQKHTFVLFYQNIESIKAYYSQLKLSGSTYESPAAALLIDRVAPPLTRELLVEADLTCHYVAELVGIHNGGYIREEWFPITYIYKENHQPEMIKKLSSKRHFERVKSLFDISSPDELKAKFSLFESENKNRHLIHYGRTTVQLIYKLIDAQTIATER